MSVASRRTLTDQRNPWGRAGGIEAQRSDLWQLVFDTVTQGINEQLQGVALHQALDTIARYFPCSIALPELRVRAEAVRRDSRSYFMPSWDEPLDAIRVSFVLDSPEVDQDGSNLMKTLAAWRTLTRAGRGAVDVESGLTLNADYRVDYAYNVRLALLRGGRVQKMAQFVSDRPSQPPFTTGLPQLLSVTNSPQGDLTARTAIRRQSSATVQDDFAIAQSYVFTNCWLAGYKLTDLAYTGSDFVKVDCTFYADNIHLVNDNEIVRATMAQPLRPGDRQLITQAVTSLGIAF